MPNINLTTRPTVPTSTQGKTWGSTFELGLFIVLIVLSYIYLIGPKQKEYAGAEGKLNELTSEVQKIDKQKEVFQRLVQEMNENKEGVAALDHAIPLDTNIGKLYVLAEYLAQSAGMGAVSVSVDNDSSVVIAGDKELAKDPYGIARQVWETSMTISAVGTMDQLYGLLKQIEQSARVLDVTSVAISQGKDSQFIFEVVMKGYSFAPEPKDENAAFSAAQRRSAGAEAPEQNPTAGPPAP